jgi:hypothetical protein
MFAHISYIADILHFECLQTLAFDRGVFSDVHDLIGCHQFSPYTPALVSFVPLVGAIVLLPRMGVGIISPGIIGIPGPLFLSLILEQRI